MNEKLRTVIGNNAAPLQLALNENWSGFSCADTNIDDGVFDTLERRNGCHLWFLGGIHFEFNLKDDE